MSKFILVTGGARSGKSDYAQARAEAIPGRHYFLATCPVMDSEMESRIARHRTGRDTTVWQTIEEEFNPAGVLKSLPHVSICLLDCLTLWINNLMYSSEISNECFDEDAMTIKAEELCKEAKQFSGTLICVTNEVGLGIVPDNRKARLYRDLVGKSNRIIAAAADEVILVSCGIAITLKEK